MTKQEYLNALKERLRAYPVDFQKEICEAFEGHFEEGLSAGESEEEIIESLGTVDEVMENIRMMHIGKDSYGDRVDELRSNFNTLSSSLRNTILGVSSLVSDSVNTAMRNINSSSYESGEYAGTEGTLEVAEGSSLRIRGKSGALDVFLDTGDRLEYHFEPTKSLFSSSEAVLKISDHEHRVTMESDGSAHLYIKVPAEISEIDISLTSGDVESNGLKTDYLIGKTISGDWEIDHCRFRNLNITTKSGDIDIDNSESDLMEISTMSGDISLSGTSGNLRALSTSGDIEADTHQGNLVYIETVSGDLEADLIASEIELLSVSGDIELSSDGRIAAVSVSSTSGDIFAEIEDTDYTAQINTLSGSVVNRTRLPYARRSKREWIVGDGLAAVFLKSVSGDIRIQ